MTTTNGWPGKPGVPRDPKVEVPTDELVRRLQHLGDWQAADRIEALQKRVAELEETLRAIMAVTEPRKSVYSNIITDGIRIALTGGKE